VYIRYEIVDQHLIRALIKVLGAIDGCIMIDLIKVSGQIVKTVLVHEIQSDPGIARWYGCATTVVVHGPDFVVDIGF
jgi:hypothetical protein